MRNPTLKKQTFGCKTELHRPYGMVPVFPVTQFFYHKENRSFSQEASLATSILNALLSTRPARQRARLAAHKTTHDIITITTTRNSMLYVLYSGLVTLAGVSTIAYAIYHKIQTLFS
jgi:hypothetical protein